MRSVLVASTIKDAIQNIRTCFQPNFRIDQASSKKEALGLLKTKRYHFLFIDIHILLESHENNQYKDTLKPFWNLNPSIEVIILARQKYLRKAVMVVNAGARDYLSYPLDKEKLMPLPKKSASAPGS
jgi:DNA-binding NtrC family response regulator